MLLDFLCGEVFNSNAFSLPLRVELVEFLLLIVRTDFDRAADVVTDINACSVS